MPNSVRRSPTALAQFEKCERQFYYQRVAKLPERPSPHLAVGILYHAAIERMIKNVAPLTEGQVLEVLYKVRKTPEWVDPGLTDHQLLEELDAALRKVWELVDKMPPVWPDGEDMQVEVWGKRYTCKLDYVAAYRPVVEDGRVVDVAPGRCVLDWKTVGGKRRRGQDDADNSAQLALYCIEAGANHAAYVEIPRDGGPLNVVAAEFSDHDLKRWATFLDAQFQSMNSRGPAESDFRLAERGHPLCSPRFCSFWDRCPGGAGA